MLTVALMACSLVADDPNKVFLGDHGDGSRAVPVHLNPLIDPEGQQILPTDDPMLPFSTEMTCGDCHNVREIERGLHFNYTDSNVVPGRPGQPWIYADATIATQIPISYRAWPGLYKPAQLGLTAWQFTKLFGRHFPGGGAGKLESELPEEIIRGFVSGKLEINCLSCHNDHPAHDQAEYALQVNRENFRWAAAASSGFATVTGSVKNLPDTYDYLMPEIFDEPAKSPPQVSYAIDTFDSKNRHFFDVVRDIPEKRCYFCHTNVTLKENHSEKWVPDEDVHLNSGLSCVDCHRNGLSHDIVRGYEGESVDSNNPLAGQMTCESCHDTGRLGAPVPVHKGLPTVHFDKLSCTACHSGPWPQDELPKIETSRAHALGLYRVGTYQQGLLPHIYGPVFAEGHDGKITPHKIIWPAFWATMSGDAVEPIQIKVAEKAVRAIISKHTNVTYGQWPELTEPIIADVLNVLEKSVSKDRTAVYIAGAKLYRLDKKGKILSQDHPAAAPYLWPLAHDVRPAAQSLGVNSCQDCHAVDSPFFFADIKIDSPMDKINTIRMVRIQGLDPLFTKLFAMSFVFRPWLKGVTLLCSGLIALVLLLYALKAIAVVVKVFAENGLSKKGGD